MEQEIKRLTELLATIDPISDDYGKVLGNIRNLYLLMYSYPPTKPEPESHSFTPVAQVVKVTEPTSMAESVSATVVAEEEPVVTQTVELKEDYTKEEVRSILSSASKSGVQIQPIIAKFVPDGKPVKFSEVPMAMYTQLVEEINNAR